MTRPKLVHIHTLIVPERNALFTATWFINRDNFHLNLGLCRAFCKNLTGALWKFVNDYRKELIFSLEKQHGKRVQLSRVVNRFYLCHLKSISSVLSCPYGAQSH